MLDLDALKQNTSRIDFREKRTGLYKVLAPFYHEDGDMYDIFVEEIPETGLLRISDYGLTLMKLSYSFDLDTNNKQEVLQNIVMQNRANIDDGQLYLDVAPKQFNVAINQFSQVISKVSNMDIISRELQKSMFFDHLKDFISSALVDLEVTENFTPTSDSDLVVDYKITSPHAAKPIYLFGVNENTKASRVLVTCLEFKAEHVPHRSLVIHEDIDKLNRFNRARITNVVDKQYATLDGFREHGQDYIHNETSA